MPSTEVSASELSIRVEGVLLPPHAGGDGLWVGYDTRSPDARYAGWGPAAEELSVLKADVMPAREITPLVGALLLPAYRVAGALQRVTSATRAAIVGEGLLYALAETLMRCQGTSILNIEKGTDLDLIVDVTGEPASWSETLHLLCSGGTVLLITPPWSKSTDFNFYPEIHRRSLRVIAQRWHHQFRIPPEDELLDKLCTLVSGIVAEEQWIRPLELDNPTPKKGLWQWFDWAQRALDGSDESQHLS